MRRVLSVACLVLIGAVVLLHAQMNPISGTWQGELHFAQGAPMRMILLITEQNAALEAKVHISNQGPQLLLVDPIKRSGQILDFEIKKLNGRFSGTIKGDQIKGTFTHSGTDIPLILTRTARPAMPSSFAKPQAP
jgi:uncharacterized protein